MTRAVAAAIAALLVAAFGGLTVLQRREVRDTAVEVEATTTSSAPPASVARTTTTVAPSTTAKPRTTGAPAPVATTTPVSDLPSDVTVARGRVVRADGSPAAGVPLTVYQPVRPDQIASASSSQGFFCLLATVCGRGSLRGQADQTGAFDVSLPPDKDIEWHFAVLPDGNRGPTLVQAFHAAGPAAAVDLGTVQLWEADPTITPTGNQLALRWPAVPMAGKDQTLALELFGSGGSPLVRTSAAGAGANVDRRLLEDQPARLLVTAESTLSVGGRPETRWRRSAQPAIDGPLLAGAPPTRGKPCEVVGGADPGPRSPCELTDGRFVVPERSLRLASEVRLTLAPGSNATVVVARACGCAVEVSADGSTWTPIGKAQGDAALLTVPAGTGARIVRFRNPSDLTTELSAWT